MNKFIKPLTAICLAGALAGCATTQTTYVDTATDNVAVMGLSYRDFEMAADEAINEMLELDSMLNRGDAPGVRRVIAMGNVVNDTMQRIDTDQLTRKIRSNLLRSGRFVTTTAVGANGPEDSMTEQVRELQNSSLFNQDTVQQNNTAVAPDYSMSGKIIQRNLRVDKRTQQTEYYFQLVMTDLKTGLAFYEGETAIIKRGDSRSVSW